MAWRHPQRAWPELIGECPQPSPNWNRFDAETWPVVDDGQLEEAVARETFEEAGVVAHGVTYVVSQPWPFPSSLMIGCHGYASSRDIVVDKTELDDARWFTRAEVADAIAASDRGEAGEAFGCPPRFAVANVLMRWWLERG